MKMKDKLNIKKIQKFLLLIFICLITSSFSKRDAYITLTSCLSKIILKINGKRYFIQSNSDNIIIKNGKKLLKKYDNNGREIRKKISGKYLIIHKEKGFINIYIQKNISTKK